MILAQRWASPVSSDALAPCHARVALLSSRLTRARLPLDARASDQARRAVTDAYRFFDKLEEFANKKELSPIEILQTFR